MNRPGGRDGICRGGQNAGREAEQRARNADRAAEYREAGGGGDAADHDRLTFLMTPPTDHLS